MIPGNPVRVLICDADCARAKDRRRELERTGYDAETAGTGIACVRHALQYWPDVVFVHGRTPRQFRSNPYLLHMEVIACHD